MFLVLVNKQDLPTVKPWKEIPIHVGKCKRNLVMGCSALTGENLEEALNWCAEAVNKDKAI